MSSGTSFVVSLWRLILVYIGALFPRLVKAETWDHQYERGDWDVLSTDTVQMGHHMVVIGYLLRAGTNPRILDVGCGTGPMFEYVRKVGLPYEHYHGVDISAVAIKRAQELGGVNATFEAADAQEFTTDQKYDAIVFNEVAWYFKDPGATFARYATYLREGGVLIVSMYDIIPGKLMWMSAKRHFRIVDSTQIRAGIHTWNVRVLAKR
jgi:predicted TPR repeat methyltransferase